MNAYKVAIKAHGQINTWKSCFSSIPLNYQPDIPTLRPVGGGPLAAFDSLQHAQLFTKRYCDPFRIFKCTVTESSDTKLWHTRKQLVRDKKYYPDEPYPEGTIFCDIITIHQDL